MDDATYGIRIQRGTLAHYYPGATICLDQEDSKPVSSEDCGKETRQVMVSHLPGLTHS